MPPPDPAFDRPIFIVSPPRSGSTLLFDTLARAPDVYTIGGESHGVIEGLPELQISAHGFHSNMLTAEDATPLVVQALRAAFLAGLRDRDGRPVSNGRIRMLEKTPKNALRIDFLPSVFPEARFIYLYRDAREVIASMIEGWGVARFVSYSDLPGAGRPWHFLLTPGWRDIVHAPLPELAAAQWATTTSILLDSLERLDAGRWVVARYDDLVEAPQREIERLCALLGLRWDQSLEENLPFSKSTISAPHREKWRAHEREIEAVWPRIEAVAARARSTGMRR